MKTAIWRFSAVVTIILTITSLSCNKNEEAIPTEPVPINLTQDQASLIGSTNDFAFDIFTQVLNNTGAGENVMISPLSISYALSMTLNGATGATRDSMLKALRLEGLTPESINASYKNLTSALLSVDKRVLMSIANSVWIEKDFTVKQSFIDILTNYYDSESRSFDITDATAPDKINKWIEDNTNGLIKEMVDKLEDNTVMLLINAIYFKGKWEFQFDKTKTVNRTFYKPGGNPVEVPMMKQKESFKVFEGDGFILAEFPYGQGNYVMDVILPDDRDGLNGISGRLTGPEFTNWLNQLITRETEVSFPKFKYGFKKKLKDVLTDMGMGIAFTDKADFSNISQQYDLLINDVTHQSFIETNEEGTEAAAATVVEIGLTSMPPAPLVLNMDHPFIYLIRETETNSIVFMGRVSDPSAN